MRSSRYCTLRNEMRKEHVNHNGHQTFLDWILNVTQHGGVSPGRPGVKPVARL